MDQEDQLVDYNEYDENGNIVEAPRETAEENSHSPITSPMSLAEDQDEDMVEGQEEASETHSQLTVLERARVQLAKQDALSDTLAENGFRLRQRISRDTVQAIIPVPMTAPTRPLVEVLSLIPREDAEQISLYHGQVFMPQYFLEKFLLPTMQLKKILEEEGNQTPEEWDLVPGGPETAMMYAIFRQSQAQEYSAQSGKLRALIAHSNEQTGDLVCQIREDMSKKTVTLETFVSQLRDAVQLPSARVIYNMTDEDIAEKNRLTNAILQNFEKQMKLDYNAYERERQQNVLIARLNYEQQLHIHNVNEECVSISNQRQQIVEKAIGLDVQLKVSQIKETIKELQGSLAHQCQELTQVLSPLDTTTIMETLVKLRDALKDATFQNAYLVMQNNELSLHNSFMTTAQSAAIQKAKAEQSEIYRLQRENPHYIVPIGGGRVTFKRSDEQFIPTATCISTEELLREVDEVIENKGKRAAPAAQPDPPAPAGGKGKRTLEDLPRQGDAKFPKTDGSDNSGPGESSSQGTIGNRTFKSALLNNAPSGLPYGKSQNKGAHKGKGKYSQGIKGTRHYVRPAPNLNIPSYDAGGEIKIYDIRDLEYPGTQNCTIKTVAHKEPTSGRTMHQAITIPPVDTWIIPRILETVVTDEHRETYRHALECMRQALQSPLNRLIQDEKTGGWLDCEGYFAPAATVNRYANWYYYPDTCVDQLGDYIRVLRKRPVTRGSADLEYIPNDTYSFHMVKSLLKDCTDVKPKGSRFWDDQLVRPVAGRVLYSIHDYCPGMPVNLEEECLKMHLPPFRPNEVVSLEPVMVQKKEVYHPNITASIEKMVSLGILANNETSTVEAYINTLKPIVEKYNCLVDTWAFELPRMILKHHYERLDKIRRICSIYLEQKREEDFDRRLASQAQARNGGQNIIPDGESQEQFRQDNGQGGGPI